MKTKGMKVNKNNSAQAVARATDDEIRAWIAEAAYYRAEKRGFSPGMEIDDWAAAEAEVLARTRGAQSIL